MAPSSKSEKDDNKQKQQRKHKDHVIKLLTRGRVCRKRDFSHLCREMFQQPNVDNYVCVLLACLAVAYLNAFMCLSICVREAFNGHIYRKAMGKYLFAVYGSLG